MVSTRRPIRVAIVGGYPLFREGTYNFLARQVGISVVGIGENGQEALDLVARHQPEVLILDIHVADWGGVEVTGQLRERFPEVKILIFADDEDIGSARALFALGVNGYLHKTVSGDALLGAIYAVANGKVVIEAATVLQAYGPNLPSFTRREHEVLALPAQGYRNAEIATALRRSEKTVEYHLTQILEKLGAHSRFEAVHKARRYGLVSVMERLNVSS